MLDLCWFIQPSVLLSVVTGDQNLKVVQDNPATGEMSLLEKCF